MTPVELDDGTVLMQAPARRILIGRGVSGAQPFMAFKLQTEHQLDALRRHVSNRGLKALPSPSAIFASGAFAVRDPDGRLAAFGLPRTDLPATGSECFARRETAGTATACRSRFNASLPRCCVSTKRIWASSFRTMFSKMIREASRRPASSAPIRNITRFAAFRCPETRPDHHAYEATCWNDIRDWADHLATLGIKLWWGPGRHGPGNNLFFMIQDPQGYLIEISAELEIMPDHLVKRSWKHEERTLNLWGSAFLRS